MGQRFQVYVNYGKENEHLFAMHLQWCWGAFSVIRAHQLINYIDGNRKDLFNPFGIGEHAKVGGTSFDGRRQDLYALKALTELDLTSCDMVAGHDLMREADSWDRSRFKNGLISSYPMHTVIDPLAQDNNDGFLVIQVGQTETRYAFCKDAYGYEPVSASEYLSSYRGDLSRRPLAFQERVAEMTEQLDKVPLLEKSEMAHIFKEPYSKRLNIENFKTPLPEQKREQPLSELVEEAKERASQPKPSVNKTQPSKRNDRERS